MNSIKNIQLLEQTVHSFSLIDLLFHLTSSNSRAPDLLKLAARASAPYLDENNANIAEPTLVFLRLQKKEICQFSSFHVFPLDSFLSPPIWYIQLSTHLNLPA